MRKVPTGGCHPTINISSSSTLYHRLQSLLEALLFQSPRRMPNFLRPSWCDAAVSSLSSTHCPPPRNPSLGMESYVGGVTREGCVPASIVAAGSAETPQRVEPINLTVAEGRCSVLPFPPTVLRGASTLMSPVVLLMAGCSVVDEGLE